jgi:hypothetical protein
MCNGEGYYDVKAMLKYLNQHSKFTFTYKFNPATGQMEYYIRMIRQVVHIRTSSVLKDQAVYKSMSATDFSVRFNTEVLFPSIKFFAYYSMVSREVIHSITQLDTKSFLFGVTNLANIPPVDENGWNWEFRTSYTLEDPVELKQFEKKEPVTRPTLIACVSSAVVLSRAVPLTSVTMYLPMLASTVSLEAFFSGIALNTEPTPVPTSTVFTYVIII